VTLASALVEMPESAIASTIQSVKKDSELAYIEVVGQRQRDRPHSREGAGAGLRQLRESEKINEVTAERLPYVDVPARVTPARWSTSASTRPASRRAARGADAPVRVTSLAKVLARHRLHDRPPDHSPLRRLNHSPRILDGDLTQRVDVHSSDEIGELAAAFGAMVEKLKQVVGALQDSVRLPSRPATTWRLHTPSQKPRPSPPGDRPGRKPGHPRRRFKQTRCRGGRRPRRCSSSTRCGEVSNSGETAIESSLEA